ncbi:unnamed protein product [marine sediment metagenome]|uniref:Uncharacterized protein n=1 Tax=marine sediment metagenome TaxID=412755 RepID=X1VQJ1_9ZZZZ
MEERRLSLWEKYLTLWVALCIGAGTALGRVFPQISDTLAKLEVAHISIPIASSSKIGFISLHGIQVPRPNSARVGLPLDRACPSGTEARLGSED